MIKINFNTYISFSPYVEYDMVLSGWDYHSYFGLFIIYKKNILK